MARLENGDAELASTPPTLQGDAARSGALVHGGSWAWALTASRQNIVGNIVLRSSALLWDNVPVVPGIEFALEGYVQQAGIGGGQLSFLFADDAQNFTAVAATFGAADGNGWQHFQGLWTPTGTTLSVWVLYNYPAGFGSGSVVVDDLLLDGGDPLAVMISEFGVRAVIAKMQAALNTEIGYVETEANIGLDLPTVSSWYAIDRALASPDVTEFEVFERGDILFPEVTDTESVWQAGGRIRWTSKIPITLRMTHVNRGNADVSSETLLESQMASRSRLYAAAMVRVIRNDPRCAYTDKITLIPERLRVNVKDTSRADASLRRVAQVELDATMILRETPDNETTLGGGALPSATLETP